MDYKRLAAVGMSAALALSIGGSALAKASGSASVTESSESGAPRKGRPRSDAERVPKSGHGEVATDAAEKQKREKPSRKPDRKPGQQTDGSQTAEKPKKGLEALENGTSSRPTRKTKTTESRGAATTEQSGKTQKQSSAAPTDYAAANTLTQSATDATYRSTNDSENAVLVSGDKVTLTNATVDKTGDASGDNADFYGINATVLAKDGAELTIEGGPSPRTARTPTAGSATARAPRWRYPTRPSPPPATPPAD